MAFRIEMTGFGRAMRALEESDQIAFKEIAKAMKTVTSAVKKETQARIPDNPVSGWGAWTSSRDGRDLSYDPAAIKSSVRMRMNRFRQRGTKQSMGLAYEVYLGGSGAAAGAIWALIGKGNRTSTNQGEHLVQVINDRFPIEHWRYGAQGPRALVGAYYAAKPEGFDEEIARKIANAMERAMN
jgi:hypothetical protein